MVQLTDILESIPVHFNFPRPDWFEVGRWMASKCADDEREEVWTDLARQWLERMQDAAGEGYEVVESPNFLILTAADAKNAAGLAAVGERALKEMLQGLPGIASKAGGGKFVCLSFADQEAYYDYIAHYYPEGEFGASGGVHLPDGYPHFALNHLQQRDLEICLVHELTHACLRDCPLPLWLEEGVTQIMEEAILGHSELCMTREEVRRHQDYWREHGLRSFWWGRSFQLPDDGMELSYALAQVLTRNLLSSGRETFLQLLREVELADCGDADVRRLYGIGLAALAAQFLGDGDWDCEPVDANEFYDRALFYYQHGHPERALADFRAVIASGSEQVEHLSGVAWFFSTCPYEGVRSGEEAVALATRACELREWRCEVALDTLAAAYAEQGDFDQAVRWARKAVELASAGERAVDPARLRLYEAGQPYREPLPGDGTQAACRLRNETRAFRRAP